MFVATVLLIGELGNSSAKRKGKNYRLCVSVASLQFQVCFFFLEALQMSIFVG